MRRLLVAIAVCALARPPALEGEGVRGTARPASRLPPPPDRFWDRLGGPTHSYRARSAPSPFIGAAVEVDYQDTPLCDALAMLGRAAGVRIALDSSVPRHLAAAPITLTTDAVYLRDVLDLVLLQVSAERAIVWELLGGSIRVRPR